MGKEDISGRETCRKERTEQARGCSLYSGLFVRFASCWCLEASPLTHSLTDKNGLLYLDCADSVNSIEYLLSFLEFGTKVVGGG